MTYKPWPTADQQQQEQGRTDVVGNFVLNPATGQPYDSNAPMPVSASVTPSANQRVNAQSGDFVAGAIADLVTLLTLAGTPTDANTVASLMGRLTKIRDLLNATLTVQGTITEANSAASKADLDTLVTQTLTPNVSDRWARQVGQVDIARLLGSALGVSNSMPVEQMISLAIRNGNGYAANSSRLTVASTGNVPFEFFQNNLAKNFLIYSFKFYLMQSNATHELRQITADDSGNWTSPVAPSILKLNPGGGASAGPTIKYSTTGATQVGTIYDIAGVPSANMYDYCSASGIFSPLFIPANTANYGFILYVNAANTNTYGVSVKWIEF